MYQKLNYSKTESSDKKMNQNTAIFVLLVTVVVGILLIILLIFSKYLHISLATSSIGKSLKNNEEAILATSNETELNRHEKLYDVNCVFISLGSITT